MELKVYFRVLMRRWWIGLPTFLMTFIATLVFTFAQAPMYESTATFVLKLGSSFQDDKGFVSALDILSRRAEIAATYTEVATSRLIKRQAADELNLSAQQRGDLSVSSRAVGGTNVLEITVEGPDPILAREFANMIGAKTIAYVRELYETYELEPLDQAILRSMPIKPNTLLNLTLGGIFGLVLGVGLAFLSEYLRAPLENMTAFDILDDQTGIYNKRFFLLRLQQEMSRAQRNDYHLSVALMNVDHRGVMDEASSQFRGEVLRRATMLLAPRLREEDIMARYDTTVLAFLLPDLPGETARERITELQTCIASTPMEIEGSGVKLNLHGAAGVVAFQDKSLKLDELLAKVTRTMEGAEVAAYERVYLFSENGNGHRRSRARAGSNGVKQ